MKIPLTQKFDRFRRFCQRRGREFALETVFVAVGGVFLPAIWLDFWLYKQFFFQSADLRTLILAMAVLFWGATLGKMAQRLRKIPQTDADLIKTLQLPESLENALWFARNPNPPSELKNAVIENATEEVKRLDFFRSYTEFPVFSSRLAALFTLGMFVISLPLLPVGATRFFVPPTKAVWNVPWTITWKTLPVELAEGEDFLAELVPPKPCRWVNVQVKTENETTEIHRVRPLDGRYFLRISKVQKSFTLTPFPEGREDLQSDTVRVTIWPLPKLASAEFHVVPPEYSGRLPYSGSWNLDDLPDTRVGLLIRATQSLSKAEMVWADGKRILAKPYRDVGYLFAWTLDENTAYHLELTNTRGLKNTLETWNMRVRRDEKPETKLESPQDGRPVLPGVRLPMVVKAWDDLGLDYVGFRWLAENPNHPMESRSPRWTNFLLWTPDKEKKTSATLEKRESFLWKTEPLKLSAGTTIRIQPVAQDVPGGLGEGKEKTLRVVFPEEMNRRVTQEWVVVTQEFRRMTQSVRLIAENAKNPEAAFSAMENLTRQTNRDLVDCFLPTLDALERDVLDHPTANLSVSQNGLRRLLNVWEKLEMELLPPLVQAVSLAVRTPENNQIAATSQAVLELLEPLIREWQEQESEASLEALRQDIIGRLEKQPSSVEAVLEIQEKTSLYFRRYHEQHAASFSRAERELETETLRILEKTVSGEAVSFQTILRHWKTWNAAPMCQARGVLEDGLATQERILRQLGEWDGPLGVFLWKSEQEKLRNRLRKPETPLPVSVGILFDGLAGQVAQSVDQWEAFRSENVPPYRAEQESLRENFRRLLFQLSQTPQTVARVSNRPAKTSAKDVPSSEKEEPFDTHAEVHATDVQVLAVLQQEVLDHTPNADDVEILRLETLEKKIVRIAQSAGFRSNAKGLFADILSKMNQVTFLFHQGEIGPMNTHLQEEILAELAECLEPQKDENATTAESSAAPEKSGDLSKNTDSQALGTEKETSETRSETETLQDLIYSQLKTGLWGELPERTREELKPIRPENRLPAYERRLEAYWKRLLK